MSQSLSKFSLLQVLPQIAWTNLPNGDVNFYNQKWYDYTGLDFEQTKQWSWKAVVHPDDLENTITLYNNALASGESFIVENRLKGADGQYRWHLTQANPIKNEDGEITLWVGIATEITEQVESRKKLMNAEAKFRSLVEESMVPIALLAGRDMVVEIANEPMIKLWGKGKSAMGKKLADALPELQGQPFLKMLDDVFTTGVTVEGAAAPAQLEVDGVMGTYYFDFAYKPIRDASGEIYGVMDMAIDVTDKVLAMQKMEKSQEQLLSYFNQSPVAIASLSKHNFTFKLVNPLYAEIVGRRAEDLIDKPLFEALPELVGQGFDILLEEVLITGRPFTAAEVPVDLLREGIMQRIYVNLTYQPQRDLHNEVIGILVVCIDVTEQVLARKKLEDNEVHMQLMRDTVPAMIFYLDKNQRYVSYNIRFMEWFNATETDVVGKNVREFIGETAYNTVGPHLAKAYAGEQVRYQLYAPLRSGGERWLDIVYTPHRNPEGDVMGIIVHATDVTDHLMARKRMEESAAKLSSVIESAPAAIALFVGPELIIETPNAHFKKLMNKGDAITGKPFSEILSETVEADQVFIQLIQNVYQTGVEFNAKEVEVTFVNLEVPEKKYYDINFIPLFDSERKVYAVLDVSVDVTEQLLLRKEIEDAVIERTKELRETNINLQRSNAELEQFAYIASHDLQEPVRKITTFSEMLENSIDNIKPESKRYIDKINNSTSRMSNLIRDVLAFSQVNQTSEGFTMIDICEVIETAKMDFERIIEQKRATVECGDLPKVHGIASQMAQLFGNLMSNSLKYTRPDVPPVIRISSGRTSPEEIALHPQLSSDKKYYTIEFSDNGIGFNKEHASRIFNIFQRLHGKTEFEGTGIGLSICRKIVQAHHGHISAHVGANGGAVFNIILPEMAEF